jgi:hypothetical protein
MRKCQTCLHYVCRSPVSLTHLTVIGTAIIPNYTFTNDGLNIILVDTPGFEDTNISDTQILQDISSWLARSYTLTHSLVVIMDVHQITDDKMGNSAILGSEAGNSDGGHRRTALHYAQEKWHESLVPFNSTADDFGAHFHDTMSCDLAIDPNHEEADLRNDRLRFFRCPDEDDMSSVSSNDEDSLFEYSPSVSDTVTTTTVGSRSVQQELTYTNIEHMLAVLKAERGKCLGELRGFDAALETIDQLANSRRPGSEICFNMVRVNDISIP